jgi:hypothetical protein
MTGCLRSVQLRKGLWPLLLSLLAACLVSAPMASAVAPRWVAWRLVGPIDPHGLTAIVCPGRSLCVAADNDGSILTSLGPVADHPLWKAVSIDGGNELTALACPTSDFCVAVDGDGHLFASVDPSGGTSGWKETTAPVGLDSLSCPALGLCVAGGHTVFVSTNVSGGTESWSQVPGSVDVYGCDTGSICSPTYWLVSCPSAHFCAAGDGYSKTLTSLTPAVSSTGWTTSPAAQTANYDGLSCTSEALCVGVCSPNSTFACGGEDFQNDNGVVFSWDPQNQAPEQERFGAATTSALGWNGIWCMSATECFTGSQSGLYGSTTPQSSAAWPRLASASAAPQGPGPLGVSCPTAERCVAIEDALAGFVPAGGLVLIGSPPATNNQIRSMLRTLVPATRVKRERLVRGYDISVDMPYAGDIHLTWLGRYRDRQRIIATATRITAAAGLVTVKVSLTRVGRRLLTSTDRLYLTVENSFTGTHQSRLAERFRFSLRVTG